MAMTDTMEGNLVTFESTDGLVLHGFLVKSTKRSKKAVIYLHGLEGTFYRSNFMKVFAGKLIENGFSLLTIEQRGSYTALGLRKRKGRKLVWQSAGGGFEKFEECVHDIEGAIRFLSKNGMRDVYLAGHSTGCQKIAYYQYKRGNGRVKALVLAAPGDDYNAQRKAFGKGFDAIVARAKRLLKSDKDALMPNDIVKRPYSVARFLSYSDLRNVEARLFNYHSRMKEFKTIKVPVLALFGSDDEFLLMPAKEQLRILESNSGSRSISTLVINRADHGFDGRESHTASAIVEWLLGL